MEDDGRKSDGAFVTTDKHGREQVRRPDGSFAPKAAKDAKLKDAPRNLALNESHLAVMSDLLGRMRMAQKAGMQYGGVRDIYSEAGYVKDEDVNFDHYWALYKRGDVAGRIVDMPAKTTWRTPPDVIEQEEPEGTAFTEAFEDLAKQQRLWHFLERVDRLAGVGRYAILLIGMRGNENLATPARKVSTVDNGHVLFLSPYNEQEAQIESLDNNPNSPRFGLPETYQVTFSELKGFTKRGIVHWSRVLHIAEDLLQDEVYGRPRLRRPLNRLYDLEKVAASTGEAYWQQVTRILQANIDPDAEIADDFYDTLDEKLGELVHQLRRQFYGQGVDLNWLNAQTPNVSQVADFYFSLIAGSSGIPKRILFGSELGELASSQDQSNFLGMVNERQEQFAEPMMVRAFIDRMLLLGILPPPTTAEYHVVWPSLFEETDVMIADANVKRAEAAAKLAGTGGDPLALIGIDDDGKIYLVPREPGETLSEEEMLPGPPEEEGDEPEPGEEGEEPEEGEEEGEEPEGEEEGEAEQWDIAAEAVLMAEEDERLDDVQPEVVPNDANASKRAAKIARLREVQVEVQSEEVLVTANPYSLVKRGERYCVVKTAAPRETVKCYSGSNAKSRAQKLLGALESNVED